MAKLVKDLKEFKKLNQDKMIGTTFSCWDLLHCGHSLFLADSKRNCDVLIVGLQTDPTIDRPEKNKPAQTLEEREIQIKSSRYVDYYFIYDTEEFLLQCIEELEPNIRFLGDDYVGKKFTGHELPVNIFFHPRSNYGYSTTELRNRIYLLEKDKN